MMMIYFIIIKKRQLSGRQWSCITVKATQGTMISQLLISSYCSLFPWECANITNIIIIININNKNNNNKNNNNKNLINSYCPLRFSRFSILLTNSFNKVRWMYIWHSSSDEVGNHFWRKSNCATWGSWVEDCVPWPESHTDHCCARLGLYALCCLGLDFCPNLLPEQHCWNSTDTSASASISTATATAASTSTATSTNSVLLLILVLFPALQSISASV